ncbi:MAG TPA: hypothetical protein VKZ67_08945 [Natronosporangium sp.]|nr:hypothetical protein [Natronosporangium sp.]
MWRRRRPFPRQLNPGERWPDGDMVVPRGRRRSADMLRDQPAPAYRRRPIVPRARRRLA